MLHIINNIKSNIEALEKAKDYFTVNTFKTFGPKTMEKIQENLLCYYSKNKIDVLNKFEIGYNITDGTGNTRREWDGFNVYNSDDLLQEIVSTIEYRKKTLEKAEKTLKDEKFITDTLEKIIELTQSVSYDVYNSEMVRILSNRTKNNYYLANTLK